MYTLYIHIETNWWARIAHTHFLKWKYSALPIIWCFDFLNFRFFASHRSYGRDRIISGAHCSVKFHSIWAVSERDTIRQHNGNTFQEQQAAILESHEWYAKQRHSMWNSKMYTITQNIWIMWTTYRNMRNSRMVLQFVRSSSIWFLCRFSGQAVFQIRPHVPCNDFTKDIEIERGRQRGRERSIVPKYASLRVNYIGTKMKWSSRSNSSGKNQTNQQSIKWKIELNIIPVFHLMLHTQTHNYTHTHTHTQAAYEAWPIG